ncbi:MAG: pyrroline-5-carboxylate reductase [Thermodesulfobacteriota bacterium]|nr:pyrroline-5-carboxylate reductase [Thermodesulfobacteriota bacterium]
MQHISGTGFIGGGNMAQALICGLLDSGVPPETLMVAELMPERRQFLAQTYGVITTGNSAEVVAAYPVIILAVKPQALETALLPVADLFDADKCLISILAGVSTAKIEAITGDNTRVLRVMPNTPALIGAAATGLCGGRHATADDLEMAQQLFACVGIVEVVKEALLDAVTGLSGSGPAYVYLMIEALTDGGVLEGLPHDTALRLAAQTVVGAAQMVLDGNEHPAVLRDRVCSPAGTTIAALQTLEQGGVRAALINAVQRSATRSRELG